MSAPESSLDAVRIRVLAGAAVRLDDLPGRAQRALGLAAATGAPAAPALDAAIAARDDVRRRRRAMDVATSQARAVMLGLSALPLIAVPGLGFVLDEPLWRYYLTPVGAVTAGVGIALLVAGVAISMRLVAVTRAGRSGSGAQPVIVGLIAALAVTVIAGVTAGIGAGAAVMLARARTLRGRDDADIDDEAADLVATALAAGLPPAAALRAAADVLPELVVPLRRAALAHELGVPADVPPRLERIVAILDETTHHGGPAEPALRGLGTELRADEQQRALEAAERLPVLLAFPTALCLLPACVLLVGAPLLAVGLELGGGLL